MKDDRGEIYDVGLCLTEGFTGRVGCIDFTNPEARRVHGEYLRRLFELGASGPAFLEQLASACKTGLGRFLVGFQFFDVDGDLFDVFQTDSCVVVHFFQLGRALE